jgi:two-component system sensor histidine kinase ComP
MRSEVSLILLEPIQIDKRHRFHEEIELAAYRFIEEGIKNSLKHSGTNRLTVRLELKENRLALTVSDLGRGFDSRQLENWLLTGIHGGLIELKERIEFLGGEFQIDAAVHKGTTLKAFLPVSF